MGTLPAKTVMQQQIGTVKFDFKKLSEDNEARMPLMDGFPPVLKSETETTCCKCIIL